MEPSHPDLRARASFVPPLLLGVVLAISGEVTVGLLLYGGPGFLPALSTILAVLILAFGLGLHGRPRERPAGSRRVFRRLWFQAMMATVLALGFAAAWEVSRGFGAGPLAQGAGLALLGGFPYYSTGALLGAMGRGGTGGETPRGVGAAACFGAASGTLLVGFVLFPNVPPPGAYLVCLLLLSAAALLHGPGRLPRSARAPEARPEPGPTSPGG